MPPKRNSWVATRRSLLSRLRDWADQQSWQEFFDAYWKLIYWAATRSGLNDAAAQDVVQEVIMAVARRMPDFRYDPALGSFKNWLLQITRRRIIDQLRRHYRESKVLQPPADHFTATLEQVPDSAADDLEHHWDEEWEQNLLDAALQRVKRQVDARQFQIFDCHVLKAWSVKDVVRTLKVTDNQVYLAKSRITALIRNECERLRQDML